VNYRFLIKFSAAFVLPLLLAQQGVSFAEQPQPPQQQAAGLTLYDALAEAYQKNPDLESSRAELRSIDELYEQAIAGFKPSLSGTADYTSTYRKLDAATSNSDPKTLSLEAAQSLYSGGSTVANVSQSTNKIKAGRAKLKATEQQVFLDGVKAYMGFIRDQKIVQLSVNNENVLTNHLKASQERLKLGDITKTDVSQAESRLAKATASRISAQGALKKSYAFFEQVIGLPPANLQTPALTAQLPATEEEALAIAEKNNPFIVAAKYSEGAAKDSTRAVEGEILPRIDLSGSVSKIYDPFAFSSNDEVSRAIGIRATLPLYTGGSTISRIRQSRQAENQLRMKTRSTENSVRQAVIEAWESLSAAEAESKSRQVQIDAAKVALEGVKVEAGFGSRTTLDLLDAEQEYLDAQVAYVGAETNRIIAGYGLLATVGSLTAERLNLDVPTYDPAINFQNITKAGFPPVFDTLKGISIRPKILNE
jgi:outer membrane protein/adhesin transport system outer membrane protein